MDICWTSPFIMKAIRTNKVGFFHSKNSCPTLEIKKVLKKTAIDKQVEDRNHILLLRGNEAESNKKALRGN